MKEVVYYQWGRKGHKVSAQVVGDALEKIARAEGKVTPRRVVKEAANKDCPFHDLFTWDNTEAADLWRDQEARNIINSLVVTIRRGKQEQSAPAFISVGHRTETEHLGEGYRPISVVVADRDMTNEALAEAMSRLQAIRKRYEAIDALAPVWEAIDKAAA